MKHVLFQGMKGRIDTQAIIQYVYLDEFRAPEPKFDYKLEKCFTQNDND